jgi:alpha-ribazole phosphatase
MESKICLIRHGITEGNQKRLYYGHTDLDLAEEGVENLKELAASGLYPISENATFYTTGMRRTEQTLRLIYGEQEHEHIELLKEINFGAFEMKTYKELKDIEEYQEWCRNPKGDLAPPDCESIAMFYSRITEGFAELKRRHALKVLEMRHVEEEALTIMVCHGGTISAIMENIYPGEKDNFYKWIPQPGHGYILSMKDAEVVDTELF